MSNRYEVVRSRERTNFSETVESFETLAEAQKFCARLQAENESDLESKIQATRHDAQGWDFMVWDNVEECGV